MAFTIGSLDEKETRFVLIASGLAVVAIAALIIWHSRQGASSSATTTADSSSATPATLMGVTEDVYAAPPNLSATPPTPTPPATPAPVAQPTPAPPVRVPAPPTPARTAPVPAPRRTFVVKPWPQPGSSLWSISELEYGQSTQAHIDAIASANHIANPNLIHPGQVLIIP